MSPRISTQTSTGLTITNPLVLYHTLLATKRIDPDPAQHRLALELQKIYFRLKDYSPRVEYGARLKAISRAVGQAPDEKVKTSISESGYPLRRNRLFTRFLLREREKETLALARVLTSYESAMNLDSPRGLLLHGEVGTGKKNPIYRYLYSVPASYI
jgi:peroxisome-assembly ATPase